LNAPWAAAEATPLPDKEVTPSSLQSLHIYPNPAQYAITITTNYEDGWMGKTVSIVSAAGYIVKQVVITSVNQKINIADLKTGVYFIQADNGGKQIREKFVKL